MERRDSGKNLNVRYWVCSALFNVLVISGFGLVLSKAFCLQVFEHHDWVDRAKAQCETSFQVQSCRGSVYDAQGRLLSFSVPQPSLFAVADQIENPAQAAARLAPILGEPKDGLQKKLTGSRQFVWIKRMLTDQQSAEVERLKIKGLNLTNEYKRFYPYRQIGGQVLGFVGVDGVGQEGAEKGFDDILRAKATSVGQLRDGVRKSIWMDDAPPPESTENFGIRLTIDSFIQYICETELEKAIQKYQPRAAEVVVMDPNSFEVLAMANWPFFDPNLNDHKKNPDIYRNRVITDSFEPGSTFKVIMMSAALEESVVREKDRIYCENGKAQLAGHTINDTHPYGWLTMPEVIKYSSNIAAGKLALQLGNERYYRWIRSFGFGSDTGICLPGEVKGQVRPGKRWRPIDLATHGFGQGLAITALQLTTAMATIANGGEYGQPLIAREIVNPKGIPVKQVQPPPLRRVIQKKTAQIVRDMMQLVTQEGGTGVSAAPEGYSAAGKTGTAQVLDPVTRRYAAHKHTASFTGFVPADKPRLAITVILHEPQGSMYGGVVSAPVFREIAAKVLPYLNVLPNQIVPKLPGGARMASIDGAAKKAPAAKPPVKVSQAAPSPVKAKIAGIVPAIGSEGRRNERIISAQPSPARQPVKVKEHVSSPGEGYALKWEPGTKPNVY